MTNTIEIENLNISDLDIPTDETLQEVASSCEGIATSSESVATSCDNIATSCGDLAKDTTLQSTNTALGSLATDATLQATNTALGSISGSLSGFATDTTLQSVKGSIDDLVTAEGTILNTTLGAVAKDTTLQSTNTALGSLAADTTLQATNTALGGLNTSLGAIIKDTTGQSIDASVGNISTVLSDVATDTTLATVAKDTTLQATNTALASLMADTTGQSIATAIAALGSTLGSDKANIDGSNIANPSAFRSSLNVNSNFSYYNETTGTTPLSLPNNWKMLIAQVVYNGVYLTSIFTYNMMTASGNAVSLGNYGTSYAIGQIARTEFKITSVNWAGTNVTASSKAFIYLAY